MVDVEFVVLFWRLFDRNPALNQLIVPVIDLIGNQGQDDPIGRWRGAADGRPGPAEADKGRVSHPVNAAGALIQGQSQSEGLSIKPVRRL